MKALELLLFGFPDKIKLLNHYFRSYQKNYSFDVVGISEVEEPSTSEYFEHDFGGQNLFCKQIQKKFKMRLTGILEKEKDKTASDEKPNEMLCNQEDLSEEEKTILKRDSQGEKRTRNDKENQEEQTKKVSEESINNILSKYRRNSKKLVPRLKIVTTCNSLKSGKSTKNNQKQVT